MKIITRPHLVSLAAATLAAVAWASPAPAADVDPVETAALVAAQEYVCDFPDFHASEAALAAVVATGIPEDIAAEIVSDLAWQIAESVEDRAEFCGVMVAGGFAP